MFRWRQPSFLCLYETVTIILVTRTHSEFEPTPYFLLLTLPLTPILTFDFSTLNYITRRISQGHSLYQVWILWDHSFLIYAPDKQTNKQTNKQTDSNILPTPPDIVGVGRNKLSLMTSTLIPVHVTASSFTNAVWTACRLQRQLYIQPYLTNFASVALIYCQLAASSIVCYCIYTILQLDLSPRIVADARSSRQR